MKIIKNLRSLVLVIIITLLWSCTKDDSYRKTDFSHGDAVFSIHIKDPNQAIVKLKSYGIYKELELDDNDRLTDTLHRITESYFMFSDKRNGSGFYIKPGAHVHVELDTKDFIGTIRFSGDWAKENNYLRDYFLLNRKLARVNAIQHLAYLDELHFRKTVDSVKKLRLQLLETADRKNHLDPHFKYLEQQRILYEWANRMETYEAYRQFALQDTGFHVTPRFYDFRKQLDINNENLIIVPSYHYYLENIYQKKANDMAKQADTADVFSLFLDVVQQNVINPRIRERLLFSYALQNLKESSDMAGFLRRFEQYSNDTAHIGKIKRLYFEYNRLNPGHPAPDFTLPDPQGKMHSLSDFRGKYVYLDIWATWCRPCRAEMPYLEKLKEKYSDAPIVFIGISLDDFKTNWINFLKQYHPNGLQLYAGDHPAFRDLYQVDAVPKYILINPFGKISTALAPRPSETELIEMLFDRIKEKYHPGKTYMLPNQGNKK